MFFEQPAKEAQKALEDALLARYYTRRFIAML